ncbi:hypothetical protein DPMN_093759 [Dreissena polymorpha]|uniref:Uncharacterized protein n=1 Tax=Dreissena polymorpha TaxID=45954 RepID=A0A9D4R1A9_DREPO|nr:hypothetical protein DPMN_093759 [Dreissena polymorpha]
MSPPSHAHDPWCWSAGAVPSAICRLGPWFPAMYTELDSAVERDNVLNYCNSAINIIVTFKHDKDTTALAALEAKI